ncbi:hypothetical protein [Longimycelium tulufanense]|nr:hypothetical protein [Longimycelium tulufanense]
MPPLLYRHAALVLGASAVVLLPWMVVLAVELPKAVDVPRNWTLAWLGLDGLIAVGLATTAWLARYRDERTRLAAVATGTLLIADAWFDVCTASLGGELACAVTLALGAELPLALLCLLLASSRHDDREHQATGNMS